ncbi:alpha/beta hydrolase fold domain-containing protein [Streptomyces sp. NPDC093252]|uniref:alpha/beta hydrolase n=1 Tax=Streptomyces sp. NPDC093252 TaxID=3154980 RepID=UPI00344850C7
MAPVPPVPPFLEAAAQAFVTATSTPSSRPEHGPAGMREALAGLRPPEVPVSGAEVTDLVVAGGPSSRVPVRIVRPAGARGPLPVVLYLPGLGLVFDGPAPHGRLAGELAVRVRAATVLVDHHGPTPPARYPAAVEEVYAVLLWIAREGSAHGLDPDRVAVAGDSAGGNLAAAVTLLAKWRKGPDLAAQLLLSPVTDANFDTCSYERFAHGYFLTRDAMRWFWDRYTADPADRAQLTASPLRAAPDDLTGLPQALVVVAEAEVLRDEGEAYAAKLRAAGVPTTAVRYQGVIHGFAVLDPMRETVAAGAAIGQGCEFLSEALHG